MVLNWPPVAVYPACSGLISAVPVLAPAGIASASTAAAAAPSASVARQRKLLIDIGPAPFFPSPERIGSQSHLTINAT
jgi:hypothetical protein